VEGKAPPLQASTLEGTNIDLDNHDDWPLLIHFWATWCPMCRLEASTIDELSQSYAVVSVAMQSGQAHEVAKYLQRHGLAFSTINDPKGQISSAWRVKGVPTSFIIDKDRSIRFTTVGYTPGFTLRLRLWLSKNI
jgi:peroxiredoxin